MAAKRRAEWRDAYPEVTIVPENVEQIDSGGYTAFLFLLSLQDDGGAHGFLRCPSCGYTSVSVHRVVRVHRDEYTVSRLEVIDSLYPLPEKTDIGKALDPDPDVRGDSLAIEFRCEERHWWFIELGNHKGTTMTSLSRAVRPARRAARG